MMMGFMGASVAMCVSAGYRNDRSEISVTICPILHEKDSKTEGLLTDCQISVLFAGIPPLWRSPCPSIRHVLPDAQIPFDELLQLFYVVEAAGDGVVERVLSAPRSGDKLPVRDK